MTLVLTCDKSAGKGKPGSITATGQAYSVEWATDAVCVVVVVVVVVVLLLVVLLLPLPLPLLLILPLPLLLILLSLQVCEDADGNSGLASSGGSEFGKLFLIIFGASCSAYLVLGSYYNQRTKGYQGVEVRSSLLRAC